MRICILARKKQIKCEWCAEIKERIKEDFSYFKCPFCVGFPKVNGVEFQSTIYYNFTCKKHEKDLMDMIVNSSDEFGETLKHTNCKQLELKIQKVIEDNLMNTIIGKTMKDWESIPALLQVLRQLEISKIIYHGKESPKYKAWVKKEQELQTVEDPRRKSDLPTNEEIDEVYAKDRGLTQKEWAKKHGQ